jgi:hypothetical protein
MKFGSGERMAIPQSERQNTDSDAAVFAEIKSRSG